MKKTVKSSLIAAALIFSGGQALAELFTIVGAAPQTQQERQNIQDLKNSMAATGVGGAGLGAVQRSVSVIDMGVRGEAPVTHPVDNALIGTSGFGCVYPPKASTVTDGKYIVYENPGTSVGTKRYMTPEGKPYLWGCNRGSAEGSGIHPESNIYAIGWIYLPSGTYQARGGNKFGDGNALVTLYKNGVKFSPSTSITLHEAGKKLSSLTFTLNKPTIIGYRADKSNYKDHPEFYLIKQ